MTDLNDGGGIQNKWMYWKHEGAFDCNILATWAGHFFALVELLLGKKWK